MFFDALEQHLFLISKIAVGPVDQGKMQFIFNVCVSERNDFSVTVVDTMVVMNRIATENCDHVLIQDCVFDQADIGKGRITVVGTEGFCIYYRTVTGTIVREHCKVLLCQLLR